MLDAETKEKLILKLLGLDSVEKVDCDEDGDWKIVILQRGWVVVGRYFRSGNDCKLVDASVIRRWGTTKGLGELALSGPTNDTKLEDSGVIRFNLGGEVCRMDCKTSNWS